MVERVCTSGVVLECYKFLNSIPCAHSVWVVDATPKETDAKDKMCLFDGMDDLIRIQLPSWTARVTSMGSLWLDSWMQLKTLQEIPVIIYDMYHESTPVLRWSMQREEGGAFIVLVLNPGKAQTQVKKWGPVTAKMVGFWHHYCFTLRFARFYSSSSLDPRVSVVQAFFFIDGQPVSESVAGAFLALDHKNSLSLSTGLTTVFVGGADPKVDSRGHGFLSCAMDNIRIWWPSCPHDSDPSKCNPFAFLYPVLADGTRQPASRIQDAGVRMEHVARPVLEAMFKNTVSDAEGKGLLVALSFDSPTSDGVEIKNDVKDEKKVPQVCDPSNGGYATMDVCSGCEQWDEVTQSNQACTFGFCPKFDLDCISSVLSGTAPLNDPPFSVSPETFYGLYANS